MSFTWQGLEREVVLKRTAIVAAVTAALHLVVAAHWLTIAQSGTVIKDVTAGIDLLGITVGAVFSRAGVSPALKPLAVLEDINIGAVISDVEQIVPTWSRAIVADVAPVVAAVTAKPADPYAP